MAQLRAACAQPLGHADEASLRLDAERALAWVLHQHAALAAQTVGATAPRAAMEKLLREPAPERGRPFADVLADFTDRVAPFAFRVDHPRFLAFVPSAPSFVAVLGDFLAAGANFFTGVWLEAAGPSQVELIVLDWFRDWLGLPATTAGLLTGGGSEANLTALVAARQRLGQAERDRAILYVGAQRHWSIDRAAMVMGFRPEQVRAIPGGLTLDPGSLCAALSADRAAGLRPWAVVANAGATNTGSVDPLAALADVCAAERLWLHVDAAYGWSAVLIDEGRHALHGIARADSVTLDPHKWLAQPFDAGCVLVRDGALLAATFALRPEYLQDAAPADDEVNFCDRGIALTRRFRALKLWLSIRALGVGWFRDLVRHGCRLAELSELLLRETGEFEILTPRSLSIVCFRHVPPELANDESLLNEHNLELTARLRATGRAFLSTTRLDERVALRLCFVNWRTTTADVEEVVDLLRQLAK